MANVNTMVDDGPGAALHAPQEPVCVAFQDSMMGV